MEEIKRHFKPEFLNRLDDIVMFNPLSQQNLKTIVQLLLKDISKRVEDKGLLLSVEESAIDVILNQSFDKHYGARPIKRYLEKVLVTELSRMLLDSTLMIKDKELDGNLTITIKSANAPDVPGENRVRNSTGPFSFVISKTLNPTEIMQE